MRWSSTLASAILCFSLAVGARAGEMPTVPLKVAISGLHSTHGQILLWVWSSADGFPTRGAKAAQLLKIPIKATAHGVVETTLPLVPGTYAISILHDENGNGEVDTNFLGIPKEGYGASNNVVTHLGPLSFDKSSFVLPAAGAAIAIFMHC